MQFNYSKIISFPCEKEVISVQTNSTKVAVQLKDGSVLEYSEGMLLLVIMAHVICPSFVENGLMPWMLKDGCGLQLVEPCAHMRLATFNGEVLIGSVNDEFFHSLIGCSDWAQSNC